jgi:hypothetical protein
MPGPHAAAAFLAASLGFRGVVPWQAEAEYARGLALQGPPEVTAISSADPAAPESVVEKTAGFYPLRIGAFYRLRAT